MKSTLLIKCTINLTRSGPINTESDSGTSLMDTISMEQTINTNLVREQVCSCAEYHCACSVIGKEAGLDVAVTVVLFSVCHSSFSQKVAVSLTWSTYSILKSTRISTAVSTWKMQKE